MRIYDEYIKGMNVAMSISYNEKEKKTASFEYQLVDVFESALYQICKLNNSDVIDKIDTWNNIVRVNDVVEIYYNYLDKKHHVYVDMSDLLNSVISSELEEKIKEWES